jgi:hypothetical protein
MTCCCVQPRGISVCVFKSLAGSLLLRHEDTQSHVPTCAAHPAVFDHSFDACAGWAVLS